MRAREVVAEGFDFLDLLAGVAEVFLGLGECRMGGGVAGAFGIQVRTGGCGSEDSGACAEFVGDAGVIEVQFHFIHGCFCWLVSYRLVD